MTPMPSPIPPGTRVRTPRHGDGTVIDTEGAPDGLYDHWPVWVRLDDAEKPWDVCGFAEWAVVKL